MTRRTPAIVSAATFNGLKEVASLLTALLDGYRREAAYLEIRAVDEEGRAGQSFHDLRTLVERGYGLDCTSSKQVGQKGSL